MSDRRCWDILRQSGTEQRRGQTYEPCRLNPSRFSEMGIHIAQYLYDYSVKSLVRRVLYVEERSRHLDVVKRTSLQRVHVRLTEISELLLFTSVTITDWHYYTIQDYSTEVVVPYGVIIVNLLYNLRAIRGGYRHGRGVAHDRGIHQLRASPNQINSFYRLVTVARTILRNT